MTKVSLTKRSAKSSAKRSYDPRSSLTSIPEELLNLLIIAATAINIIGMVLQLSPESNPVASTVGLVMCVNGLAAILFSVSVNYARGRLQS